MRLKMLVLLAAAGGLGWAGGEDPNSVKQPKKELDEYIRVEVKGLLRHGVAAIGGETTGTLITARGITWELELGRRQELLDLAKKLDGKKVLVTGTLEVKKGVEIRQRWIVTVASLAAASAEGKKG